MSGFAGSLPKAYQAFLVPLLFEPYAEDLANRLSTRPLGRVLEIAAGTGVVTRALASKLPEGVSIVATDRNQPMLDQAAALGSARPVEWRSADAMRLPFGEREFDAVVCQFGVMFFTDKPKAFAEARRVLDPSGVFAFNVWDRLELNELADAVTASLAELFPDDPPRFLERLPHGYHDRATIEKDLAAGGFPAPEILTLAIHSRAPSPRDAAIGFCHGTPLRDEIEARGETLERATDAAEEGIARRFGRGPVTARMQAHVVVVENGSGAAG